MLFRSISKEEVREKLQLKLNKKIALLLGGSMGAGKLIQLVKNFNKIKDKNYLQIVVICGNNKRIYHKLLKLYGKNEMFVILGHTNQMDLYLKACDIVYTKPGGLTASVDVSPPGFVYTISQAFQSNGFIFEGL